MSTHRDLAISIIKSLPDAVRRRVLVKDASDILSAASAAAEAQIAAGCVERVELAYQQMYQLYKGVSEYKASKGRCSGRLGCMNVVAGTPHKSCSACRRYYKNQRARSEAGETKKIPLSDYAFIRKEMREQEGRVIKKPRPASKSRKAA